MRPEHVGRYIVRRRLGAGAMGVVYSAFDPKLDRTVAIKLLHPMTFPDAGARLQQEARAMARLSHPNVVTIHDVGTHGDSVFIAMEEVAGQTLAQWMHRPRRSAEVLDVMIAAGRGLAAAHAEGLVHRDFKPDNVMIGNDGRVIVMDFGLARDADKTELSEPGELVGTPAYMAPERFSGQAADARSDQFAFCVSLWEALHGERPFTGGAPGAMFLALTQLDVRTPPPDRAAPGWLQRATLKGLAPDPRERHLDMRELLRVLRRGRHRKARWTIWLAGTSASVVAAFGIYSATLGRRPCRAAKHHLEGRWDRSRARTLKAAWADPPSATTAETLERVTDRLDRYARDWVVMRDDNCRATRIEGTQSAEIGDLRNACLDRSLEALDHVVDVLAQPDDTVVRNAVRLVADLRPVVTCADERALRSGLPAPADPQASVGIAALRADLDRMHALHLAGRFEESLALADASHGNAAALGYPPVVAEAGLARGRMLAELGRLEAAEDALGGAYFAALRVHHDEVAASAASTLAYVVGYRRARHEEGLQWGEHALASALRLGDGGLAEAEARHNLGVIANAMHDADAAFDQYERSYELRLDLLPPDHPDLARSLNALGNVHYARGEYDEALARYKAALHLRERVFGPQHPEVAGALNNIAIVASRRGEFDSAIAALRRSIAIYVDAYGKSHPDVAQARNNLGISLRRSGDPAAAEVEHRRSLEIRDATQGPDHPDVGDALVGLGRALSAAGRHGEAEPLQERALALYERGFGPDHPVVAEALVGLAVARIGLQRATEAGPLLERAAALPSGVKEEATQLLLHLGSSPVTPQDLPHP